MACDRRPMRSTPLAVLALGVALASSACRGGSEPPQAGASARRYQVRGEVVALPAPGSRAPQLTLRHEAIPDFADRDGRPVGMPSMVMALDLSPSASTQDLRTGDKVEVRLAVDWSRPLLQIEQIRKLSPDTPLQLDGAPKTSSGGRDAAREASTGAR